MAVAVDEIRALASSLPRSYEVLVRGRVKFRIGQIVYLSLAPDGSTMGCGFPKEFRTAAVEAEPHKFALPSESDMRFNWIHVSLAGIDAEEMRDLVEDAWARAVPKYVAEEYAARAGYSRSELRRQAGHVEIDPVAAHRHPLPSEGLSLPLSLREGAVRADDAMPRQPARVSENEPDQPGSARIDVAVRADVSLRDLADALLDPRLPRCAHGRSARSRSRLAAGHSFFES